VRVDFEGAPGEVTLLMSQGLRDNLPNTESLN